MITLFHLTRSEVEAKLSNLGLDLNQPDDETFDRHGCVMSWGRNGKTVYVLHSHAEDEYSMTDTD